MSQDDKLLHEVLTEAHQNSVRLVSDASEIARLRAENAKLKARLESAKKVIEFAGYAIEAATRYADIMADAAVGADAISDHFGALRRGAYEYGKRKDAYDRSEKP